LTHASDEFFLFGSGNLGEDSVDAMATLPRVTISCSAPYGEGGLGQILSQVVEEYRRRDELARYFAGRVPRGDMMGVEVSPRGLGLLLRYTPARFRPDWRTDLASDRFDRAVARRLKGGETFVGFVGQSYSSFRSARRRGFQWLELESPIGHYSYVLKQQAKTDALGIERGWLSARHHARALLEYDLADSIHVASEYARETFREHGIPDEKLILRRFVPDKRFAPWPRGEGDGVYRVVYAGALTALKGVHVLLDAFSRLSGSAELTLVGGWASRGMRRFITERMRSDPRIRVQPGDPLPALRQADAYVQPTFHDGFGFAPMEALACGVPVIVTQDTGMREHVREGINGFVIPTGSVDALVERLEFLRAHASTLEVQPGRTSDSTPFAG
jgi:glycosyltransferase involved in cell wall biosynthesis